MADTNGMQARCESEKSWVALAETVGPRSPVLKALLKRFSTPQAVLTADETALREVWPEVGNGTLLALKNGAVEREADRIVSWCSRNGVRILTPADGDFPACLREIDEPPAVLYCRGKLPDMDKRLTVGIIGTRRPDAYGEQVTYKLSFELAAAGAVIVSGLAEGLDGLAAAGALNAGGETVAVLGCGIDMVYPRQHTRLRDEILQHGAVVTEFSPGTPPNGWNFPIRNRIISALSKGVTVVEAGERSGTLITARYALLQGKALFAVPGDITSPRSVGTNRLLADGALPALGTEQMLSHFRFLYRETLQLKELPPLAPCAELNPQALRRFGLSMQEAYRPAEPVKKRTKRRKNDKTAETVSKNAETATESAMQTERPPADLSVLTPRQRELYALLPEGPFSVDVLLSHSVPVAEAVGSLTVFEIYGLLSSCPGGMFEKK